MKLAKAGTPTKIGDNLEKIAMELTQDLLAGEETGPEGTPIPIPLKERNSVFKALTNYYAVKNRLAPPNDDKGGFGGYADKIAAFGRIGRTSTAGGDDTDETTAN